jgi:hypothetical protein
MNWFSRLFHKPALPHLKDTIYMRGNRWFPYLQQKWVDAGYSHRQAQSIFTNANAHCTQLNNELASPLAPADLVPGPYPGPEGIEVEEK